MSMPVSEVNEAGRTHVRIRVFGGLRVFHGEVEVDVGPPMQQVTLAVLLLSRGRTVSVNRIIDILWGEAPPASARNQVQKYVGRLRHLLEPELGTHGTGRCLVATRGGYRLETGGLDCDLTRFDEAVGTTKRATEPSAALDAARAALGLAHREAFRDLEPGIREQDEFVALDRQTVTAAVAAADAALMLGCAAEVIDEVRAVGHTAPLDEPLQARVLRLLAAEGRMAEALIAYEGIRQRLREELGVDPGAELRGLYAELLRLSVPGGEDVFSLPTDTDEDHLPIPHQLPADVAGYIERAALSDVFDRLSVDRDIRGLAVSGMPGIGKTALAVRWAHRLTSQFPDGQLFANLRGFDPVEAPVAPASVLDGFLRALGVDRANQSSDLLALSNEFRSAVSGKRILVLLDNAHDADQVRPLLPGSRESLVIITSRHQLPSLVAREGAHAVRLDPLPHDEANALLASRLGSDRLETLTVARDNLLAACSGLPLALTIVSARAALNPQLNINDIAKEIIAALQNVHGGTATLPSTPDLDVVSIFDWSYDQLTSEAAELFTSLSASPNRIVPLRLAASLMGRTEDECRALARQLTDASLLGEPSTNTYVLHDLLRAYATAKLDAEGRLDMLESRIDQYYLHSTRNAYLTSGVPARDDLGACPPGILAEDFSDFTAACEWYLRERSVLDVVTRSLSSRDDKRDAVRLAIDRRLLSFEVDSYDQFVDILEYALECAEALGDDTLLAEIRRHLGRGLGALGRYEEGKLQLELATETFRRVEDELGQMMCLYTRASLAVESGDLEQAQADYIDVTQRARAHEMDWLACRSALQAAYTFQLQSNYPSALEWCYLAKKMNTAEDYDLPIRHELVCCYTELRRYEEAIEVAEQHPPLFGDQFVSDHDMISLPFLAYSYYRIGNIPKALAACARFLPRIAEIRSRLLAPYTTPTDLQRVQEILLATGNEHWAAGLAEESV